MRVSSENSQFPHRTNQDGTIDSICPHCFLTIGSSSCESDLERMESAHVCDPLLVSYYEERSEPMNKPELRERPTNSSRRNVA